MRAVPPSYPSSRSAGLGIGIDYGPLSLVQVTGGLTVVGPPLCTHAVWAGAPAGNTLLNQPAYEQVSTRHGQQFVFEETEIVLEARGPNACLQGKAHGRGVRGGGAKLDEQSFIPFDGHAGCGAKISTCTARASAPSSSRTGPPHSSTRTPCSVTRREEGDHGITRRSTFSPPRRGWPRGGPAVATEWLQDHPEKGHAHAWIGVAPRLSTRLPHAVAEGSRARRPIAHYVQVLGSSHPAGKCWSLLG